MEPAGPCLGAGLGEDRGQRGASHRRAAAVLGAEREPPPERGRASPQPTQAASDSSDTSGRDWTACGTGKECDTSRTDANWGTGLADRHPAVRQGVSAGLSPAARRDAP